MLSQARLKELFSYDPASGEFSRIVDCGNQHIGSIAGCIHRSGYVGVRIDGKYYLAHRLAWLYTNGSFPAIQIDHINGDRSDNRMSNLREATRSQNARNAGLSRRNTSGVKGVTWNGRIGKWQAQIRKGEKLIYLGVFEGLEAARTAYLAAAESHFGEFAEHLSRAA